uniref:Uncharacterized protein n=1 Tax=Oryza barthii TaxID=65489 RepID=A0A0D3GZN9_9ORYZ
MGSKSGGGRGQSTSIPMIVPWGNVMRQLIRICGIMRNDQFSSVMWFPTTVISWKRKARKERGLRFVGGYTSSMESMFTVGSFTYSLNFVAGGTAASPAT